MTSRQHKKVRYVKCPKCARILPESERFPLYTCGGCDTILQAKYYRRQKELSVPTLPTVDVQSNGNGHACEVDKSSDSSQRSSGEMSSVQNEESNEKAVDDCNTEQITGKSSDSSERSSSEKADCAIIQKQGQLGSSNSPNELSSDKDHSIVGDKEAKQLPMEIGTREDGSDHDRYDGTAIENQDDDDEQIRKLNYTCETSRVNEAKLDENNKRDQCEDVALDKQEEVEHGNTAKEASMAIQSEPIEKPMQFEPDNVAGGSRVSGNEINCPAEDKPVAVAKLDKEEKGGKEQKSFIERIQEKLMSVTSSNDSPKSTEVEDGNEKSLPGAEASLGAYASHSASAPSSASETGKCELNLSDIDKETSGEKVENFEDSALNESGQNRPPNKAETSDSLDLAEKAGNFLKQIQRSSTKGSLAYDGSVSSCDGNDDQVPGEQEHLNVGTFSGNDGVSGFIGAEENSRSQPRGKTSSSQLSDEGQKHSMLEEQEAVRENEIQGYSRTRQHRDDLLPPGVPNHRKSSEMAFETGSSSSYVNDEPPSNWTRNHLCRYEEQQPWRRMTHGQRGFIEGRRFPEPAWRENDVLPMYHNDEIFSGDFYQKERYHGYSDVRRRAGSRFLSGNLPRTRYSGDVYNGRYQIHSGEVYNGRYQMHDHYMDRHPDARGWFAQLPSGPPGYRQGPMTYMDPSGRTSWNLYDPYPNNPQKFWDFESYGWAHDTAYLSDDQRHKEWITRRSYIREKRQVVKRHFRPMAGGAPFITCHFCFKVLQLPEDFLLFKRRKTHRLKCGACSHVLEFSLENNSCLAPRLPYSIEGAETNPDLLQQNSFGALGRENSKLESSNSRTGERVEESSDGGNDAASSSVQSKQVKVTWNLPARSKSPLHQLLGYSSPQDLLTAHTVDDEE